MKLTDGTETTVEAWVAEVVALVRPYVRALADTYLRAGVPFPPAREQAEELFNVLTNGAVSTNSD